MKFNNQLADAIYTSDMEKLGENALQAMQNTIYQNGGVGTVTGYYDDDLTILSVSDLLLHNLNHSYASLMERTKGSLKNLFYGENVSFLEPERFRQIRGAGEGQILTADGAPVYVRCYKEEAVDADGRPLWVLSVQVNWAYEDLALVNESIHSAPWTFECDETGRIVRASWSHAFRQLLGYHDILDFPNQLDSWSELLHPEDKDRVMTLLLETVADRTNTTKFSVEYRLKLRNGPYQWFRASAEVIRRLDGTASRIAGIIRNIEEEKRSRMQAQRAEAFHRAFTSANLCEYYVNLEQNTFDTFKVEASLLTAFEQSQTWDELVKFFVDNYVVEQDKQKVTDFYDRAYITEKLKGLETELRQDCCIILNGEKRWVSNVVMRGEIGDSDYAMIFLRDVTESKAETARRMQMASDNASMELLIQSMVRLLDRFVVCDLENDRYRFYNLRGEAAYEPTGTYHDFVEQVVAKYKTLESLDALDAIISPESIRRNLQGENDIYKFEYCSLDENTYKIASFIPLEWDGTKLVKVLLASMDASQEKKAEIESHKALKAAFRAAENASRAKTEFLSNMSHDIRTPMNAIVGLTAIAGANIENQDKVVECLGKITKSSRHLLGLINEVLDMARIESGRMSLAEEDFSLPELVDNLIESAPNKGTKITVTVYLKLQEDEKEQEKELLDLPVLVVDDDQTCCESTVETLREIGIAGEWVLTGKGAVERCAARHKTGRDYFAVILDWKMPEMDGIATARKIRECVGEDVTIIILTSFEFSEIEEEARAAGVDAFMAKPLFRSRLTATLRQFTSGKKEQDARNYLEDFAKTDYTGKRLLLVEDNDLNREIATEILGMTGVTVETAENGKIAVEKVAAAPEHWYNLVLMDIQMPVMNGYEATAAIRSLPGSRGKVPIIAMTANAFAEDVQLAKNTGMNEHIAKPLDLNKLNDVLKQWL